MSMELFRLTADIQLIHMPYTGAAPAVNDLLGGHVQTIFADGRCCSATFRWASCARS